MSGSVVPGRRALVFVIATMLAGANQGTHTLPVAVNGAPALAGDALEAENDLERPARVLPIETAIAPSADGFDLTLAPQSLTVLRARLSK